MEQPIITPYRGGLSKSLLFFWPIAVTWLAYALYGVYCIATGNPDADLHIYRAVNERFPYLVGGSLMLWVSYHVIFSVRFTFGEFIFLFVFGTFAVKIWTVYILYFFFL